MRPYEGSACLWLPLHLCHRVSIGIELMANPSTVFLDEPTTGLDASGAQTVMRAVHEICYTMQVSPFFVPLLWCRVPMEPPSGRLDFCIERALVLDVELQLAGSTTSRIFFSLTQQHTLHPTFRCVTQ